MCTFLLNQVNWRKSDLKDKYAPTLEATQMYS